MFNSQKVINNILSGKKSIMTDKYTRSKKIVRVEYSGTDPRGHTYYGDAEIYKKEEGFAYTANIEGNDVSDDGPFLSATEAINSFKRNAAPPGEGFRTNFRIKRL